MVQWRRIQTKHGHALHVRDFGKLVRQSPATSACVGPRGFYSFFGKPTSYVWLFRNVSHVCTEVHGPSPTSRHHHGVPPCNPMVPFILLMTIATPLGPKFHARLPGAGCAVAVLVKCAMAMAMWKGSLARVDCLPCILETNPTRHVYTTIVTPSKHGHTPHAFNAKKLVRQGPAQSGNVRQFPD